MNKNTLSEENRCGEVEIGKSAGRPLICDKHEQRYYLLDIC